MKLTFDFAARLPLDTFGFNRLCVYRGTPLWHEYMARGLVNDQEDWYKYFKCSEIDPTCMKGPEINAIRAKGLRRLFYKKLFLHPIQTFTLLRRFLRYMPLRDIYTLLSKPFRGKKSGATRAEVLSRAVEHADLKSSAADLTQLSDEKLEAALQENHKA
jgi:hypothetical protein